LILSAMTRAVLLALLLETLPAAYARPPQICFDRTTIT
jgi:hypothetical protein